ncbi:hypothetical protein GIB67_004572 [Kingdonia uniflora]|uniref:Uncharacterized protein n=1 Tax=Kingdonia uniflora TaxID=39325 RepID=A0A7J7MLH1_9MAGN|nr:hypothetical protein GIB67_004572 [Kingdonia uniflora]
MFIIYQYFARLNPIGPHVGISPLGQSTPIVQVEENAALADLRATLNSKIERRAALEQQLASVHDALKVLQGQYVVDAANRDGILISRSELLGLLMKPSLNGIPLLILGNKIDKSEALSKLALVDQMGLDSISGREVCCYMISCKDSINIDVVIDWLIKHSKTAK